MLRVAHHRGSTSTVLLFLLADAPPQTVPALASEPVVLADAPTLLAQACGAIVRAVARQWQLVISFIHGLGRVVALSCGVLRLRFVTQHKQSR